MRDVPIPLAELAARQHGVVGGRQLAAFGLDRAAVWRRVQDGRLHRIHRGVYAVGHARLTRESRWMAAVLRCGPGAALSHRSAAALWGFHPASSSRAEVAVPRDSEYRSTLSVIVHRPLPPAQVTLHDGIAVTTPAQTLVDLSSVLPRPALQRALAAAETLRWLDVNSLPAQLAEMAGAIEPTAPEPA